MSQILAAIDSAREELRDAGLQDCMRALARREYFDHEEAVADEPPCQAATWDDVELAALGLRKQDMAAHQALPEHAGWLRDGGPARLWDRLSASKCRAEATARLVREAKGDPAVFDAIADLEQWRMDEMVRLYLQEAAQ